MIAERDRFRHTAFGIPSIGGRYSVLSDFGLVPAAAMGLDLGKLLGATEIMDPDVRHRRRPVAGLRAAVAATGRGGAVQGGGTQRRAGRRTPRAAEVRHAWRLPAGRLGFWIHLSTMAGPMVFAVLWGYPYLTQGLGYPPGQASSCCCCWSSVAWRQPDSRPAHRPPSGHPRRIALAVASLCLTGWLTLILWPGGQPPVWVVVVVVGIFSIGGPASVSGSCSRGITTPAPDLHGDRSGQRRRVLRLGGHGLRGRADPRPGRAGC